MRVTRMWRRAAAAVPLGLLLLGLATGGCGGPRPATDAALAGLTPARLAEADRLYAQLVTEHQLHRDRKVLELAGSLLDYYATYPRNDEVLVKAVEASRRLGDEAAAGRYLRELLSGHPGSPLLDRLLRQSAELAVAAGDTAAAARYHFQYFLRDPARSTRTDGFPQHADWFQALDAAELGGLMAADPQGPLWNYLGSLRTGALLAEGSRSQARQLVTRLQEAAPRDRWTLAAAGLLEGQALPTGDAPTAAAPVQARSIGVLSPLTGRYAVLGNAFVDAALLAVSQANAETGLDFKLMIEDTGGDPVIGALSARRLCRDEGVIALLGALMSNPTATAALVADRYGTPLVSPTATNDRLRELGDGIFQPNLTSLYEIRLLAQLATTVLLKQRYALLYPDTPEDARTAQVFAEAVVEFGGEVVGEASFPPQGTDFKEPILALRRLRPEVLFVPATVDQMVLLGPQLDFYHAGSLVLGLSNWNSEKLLERAGRVLERAVFPSDLALFPARWTAEFEERWNGDNYPREATALALKAYQATRMLLDTLAGEGIGERAALTAALQRRLASRGLETEGLETFEGSVRLFSDLRIEPFPSALFTESWALTEGLADTLAVLPTDSLEAPPTDY